MLEDVADYVRADFNVQECPAQVLFGSEYWDEHAVPPRVVFFPADKPTDTFQPALAQQAAGIMPQTIRDWAQGQNPRSIYRRIITGKVNIWAGAPIGPDPTDQRRRDQAALDALVNQTISSLHRCGPNVVRPVSGTQISGVNWVRLGLVYELWYSVEIPVLDLPRFPPGVIDTGVQTWPTRPADYEVTAYNVDSPASVLDGVQFVVSEDDTGES